MHSPPVCASCTMRNVTEPFTEGYGSVMELLWSVTERYGALWKRYGSVTGPLQNVTEALRGVAER